jgi:hypothetical protein
VDPSSTEEDMSDRQLHLELDVTVRIEDWPALAGACQTALRRLPGERIATSPLDGFSHLALSALQGGIPGVIIEPREITVSVDPGRGPQPSGG